MPLLARRGFTIVELLVALTLLGIVSTAIYKVLVNNQRLYLAQTQTIDLNQNLRAAAAILPAELRELDAVDGDITFMGPDSIRIRAMRQLAFVCATPQLAIGLGQIVVTIRTTPIYGNRQTFSRVTRSWSTGKATPRPGMMTNGSMRSSRGIRWRAFALIAGCRRVRLTSCRCSRSGSTTLA